MSILLVVIAAFYKCLFVKGHKIITIKNVLITHLKPKVKILIYDRA